MNSDLNEEADRVIEEFLDGNPHPTAADWKRLMDANPRIATELVDAAVVHRGRQDTDEQDDGEEDESDAALVDSLFSSTVSQVINLLHETPSTMVKKAEQKVAEAKGPAARRLAQEIGLGSHITLLNGVLVGRIAAPMGLLKALEKVWEVPMVAMAEVFRSSFLNSEVPAFKSDVTPEIPVHPRSWEESVNELSLSQEERARLLAFAKEG